MSARKGSLVFRISRAARYALSFMLSLSAAVVSSGEALAQTRVPSDWSLVPSGLDVGDQFRLLFVSSTTRNATSGTIGDYDSFIQNLVAAGHSGIQVYSSLFRAVGCTSSVDARDHTSTTYTSTDKGVPIYWLGGAKASDDYEDFYDGGWDEEATGQTEGGSSESLGSGDYNEIFTGCNSDGTKECHSPVGP